MADNKIMGTFLAAGAGAALMFFLDPDRGKRRRALVRDKTAKLAREGRRSLTRATRDLTHRTHGVMAETRSRIISEPDDDVIIAERIRAKMGRVVSYPSAIDVLVVEGIATLRGDILESELPAFLRHVRSTRGVCKVEHHLTAHANSAGVPALQGQPEEKPDGAVGRLLASPGKRMLAGLAGGALAMYGIRKEGATATLAAAAGFSLLAADVASLGFRNGGLRNGDSSNGLRLNGRHPNEKERLSKKLIALPVGDAEEERLETAAKHEERK